METKVCKTCGESKPLSCFWALKTGRCGVQAHCIDCGKIRLTQRYLDNREQCLTKAKEYRKTEAGKQAKKRYSQSEKGRGRQIKYLREYRMMENVRQKRQESLCEFREKARNNRIRLSNGYVKQIIKTLSGGVLRHFEIPESLVEIKKQSLLLKRLLKQKKQKNEQFNSTDI